MAGFDEATALHAAGPGAFDVHLDDAWSIGGKLNGGYLLALLGRAAGAAVGSEGHPHPVAASAHFLHAPDPGPAGVEVAVLRAGRTLAQVRASLLAGGRPCVEALVTVGGLDGATWWDGVPPVQLPPIEQCPRLPVQGPGFEVPLMAVVAEHLDPAVMGWAVGRPSGVGELRGWAAHADGRDPDPVSLLMMVDALPPATFDLGSAGWVPTLELTCHVRAVPAPGPLAVRQRVRHVAGGRVDEECDVWDSTGRLVATGHQLAGLRVPEGQAPAGRR
jgi:acyl-coenzyme A thioesterase PaaI-like protein